MANSGNFFGSSNPNEWLENLRISNPDMFNTLAASFQNPSAVNVTQNPSAFNTTQNPDVFNTPQNNPQTFHSEAYHSPNAYSSPQNSLGNLGYYGLYGNSPVMQSTPEHVPETQADEMADEEEVVIVKQQSSRKKPLSKELVDKWTPAENTALISAYIQVSTCSIVGTNQRKTGIWGKVAELICVTAKERPGVIRPRTHASCKGRYSRIQELVNKFSGHYAAAERLLGNASGYNESDVIAKAHELYEEDKGATFPLEYCWRMMEEQPKWAQTQPQPRPAKRNIGKGKTKACDSSLSTGNQPSGGSEKRNKTDVDGHYTESIPTSDEQNTSDKRPIGRDAAKAAAKGKGKNVGYSSSSSTHAETMQNYSASIDMFAKNQATAMEFEREKANWQRQERRENLLSTLLQKEISGKELSQKEQEVKEKLLNYLDIA